MMLQDPENPAWGEDKNGVKVAAGVGRFAKL